MRAGHDDERTRAACGDGGGEVAGTERESGENAGGDPRRWHRIGL